MRVGIDATQLNLTDSNVLNNDAGDGGEIWVGEPLVTMASAIYDDHAARGGGIFVAGGAVAQINDSTLSGDNAGGSGGALYADADANNAASVKSNSTTVAGNSARTGYPQAGTGGRAYIVALAAVTGTATVFGYNSISNFPISPNDCAGALISGGFNFISTNSGCATSGDSTVLASACPMMAFRAATRRLDRECITAASGETS